MIASHEGLMFYYLEPVGTDSGLESMIVARSTASNTYAYESGATVRNDLNPLNPPGLEGKRHIRKELASIRRTYTIPAWVAYQHAARLQLGGGPDAATNTQSKLEKATAELTKDVQFHHGQQGLHQLVREFDGEINDILWKTARVPVLGGKGFMQWIFPERSRFEEIVLRNAHHPTRQELETETPEDKKNRLNRDRDDALFLMQYVQKYAPRMPSLDGQPGPLIHKYQELIDSIGDHVFRDSEGRLITEFTSPNGTQVANVHDALTAAGYATSREGWNGEYQRALDEIAPILSKIEEIKGALVNATPEQKQAKLNDWEQVLHEYAISIGENVEIKKMNGMRKAGHSLGGGTQDSDTYEDTAGSNRMPTPGSTLYARMYDDPGMAEEDNVHQYQFLMEHKDVMTNIGSKIDVYHSHDYGDVVPLGSSGHLGAITPNVERGLLTTIQTLIKNEDSDFINGFEAWRQRKYPDNKTLIPDLLKSDEGKNILLEYAKTEIQNIFSVVSVIKTPTGYVMEGATGDYQFKHGTQYDASVTKVQKEGIIEVVNQVSSKQLTVDPLKDIRLLGGYFQYLFPREYTSHKQSFPSVSLADGSNIKVFSNPELCVKLKAAAKQAAIVAHGPEVVKNFPGHIDDELTKLLSDSQKVQNLLNDVDAPAEAARFLDYKKRTKLTPEELEDYAALSKDYSTVYETASKAKADTEHKQSFHKIIYNDQEIVLYSNPKLCVKLKAAAKQAAIDAHGLDAVKNNPQLINNELENLLNNNEKIGALLPVDTPPEEATGEAARFFALSTKVKNGTVLSAKEKEDYKNLLEEYGPVNAAAERLVKQKAIIDNLKTLAKRRKAIEIIKGEKKLEKGDLIESTVVDDKVNTLPDLTDDELEKFISTLHNEFQAIEANPKDVELRKGFISRYGTFLNALKNNYEFGLSHESKEVKARNIGGVSETYMTERELGNLAGFGFAQGNEAKHTWGTGIFNARRVAKFMTFMGSEVAPFLFYKSFNEESRDEHLQQKGHGDVFPYRDQNKTFIVDSSFGAHRTTDQS